MQFSPTSYHSIPVVCMFVSLLHFKLIPIYLITLEVFHIFKKPSTHAFALNLWNCYVFALETLRDVITVRVSCRASSLEMENGNIMSNE
jgi:hypothetical protein